MTTKEKAKAYDEALKVLHKYDGANIMFTQDLKEEMFPELKESEDERIRKYIVECVEKYGPANAYPERFRKMLAYLEKQNEQNPADKVEPKFEVGDWVVYTKYGKQIQQIQKVYDDGSYLTNDYRLWAKENETYMHLWTIQDAKDGDVLVASDNSIFLFKDTIDCACKHYVALTTDGAVNFNKGLEHLWETSIAVHPATKEQRDLLFQKMHEAGYEWDAEKKELKKIEQKPAWSEEDEKMFKHIIAKATLHFSSINYLDEEEINFLKSLRPQSQWKPSEEQMEAMYAAVNLIVLRDTLHPDNIKALDSLYNDLKAL